MSAMKAMLGDMTLKEFNAKQDIYEMVKRHNGKIGMATVKAVIGPKHDLGQKEVIKLIEDLIVENKITLQPVSESLTRTVLLIV